MRVEHLVEFGALIAYQGGVRLQITKAHMRRKPQRRITAIHHCLSAGGLGITDIKGHIAAGRRGTRRRHRRCGFKRRARLLGIVCWRTLGVDTLGVGTLGLNHRRRHRRAGRTRHLILLHTPVRRGDHAAAGHRTPDQQTRHQQNERTGGQGAGGARNAPNFLLLGLIFHSKLSVSFSTRIVLSLQLSLLPAWPYSQTCSEYSWVTGLRIWRTLRPWTISCLNITLRCETHPVAAPEKTPSANKSAIVLNIVFITNS